MENSYVPLAKKEEMWAKMLLQVLQDNHIPCTALPIHGAGFALKTGCQDEMVVFVPAELLPQAKLLLEELFSEDNIIAE